MSGFNFPTKPYNQTRNANFPSKKNGKGQRQNNNSSKQQQQGKRIQQPQRSIAPVNSARGSITVAPKISYGKKSCRIVHRELIRSVIGSVNFHIDSVFSINPGINGTFPWLSIIAQNWEKYKFHKLTFKYYTRTSTLTVGSIMLIPEYDPSDSAPSSEQIASAYQGTTENAPWKDFSCSLNPKDMHDTTNLKFIRVGPLQPNQDIKMYDVATMYIATTDGVENPWGKLWVEYDVELDTPQLQSAGAITFGGQIHGGSTPTNVNPFGANPRTTVGSLGIAYVGGGASSSFLINNPGTYIIAIDVNGTGIGTPGFSSVTGGTMGGQMITNDSTGLGFTNVVRFVTTAPNATFRFGFDAATTITHVLMDIASAPATSLEDIADL